METRRVYILLRQKTIVAQSDWNRTDSAILVASSVASNRHRGESHLSSPATVAVGTRVNLAPPAQIRTGRIAAYGSYRRYLALKRMAGRGGRITALGIQ